MRIMSVPDVDGNNLTSKVSTLTVFNTTSDDAGDYTCIAKFRDKIEKNTTTLDLSFEGRLLNITKGPIRQNKTNRANVTLQCLFEGKHNLLLNLIFY